MRRAGGSFYFPSLTSIDLEERKPPDLVFASFLFASLSELSAFLARAEDEARCNSSWSLKIGIRARERRERVFFFLPLDESKTESDQLMPFFLFILPPQKLPTGLLSLVVFQAQQSQGFKSVPAMQVRD